MSLLPAKGVSSFSMELNSVRDTHTRFLIKQANYGRQRICPTVAARFSFNLVLFATSALLKTCVNRIWKIEVVLEMNTFLKDENIFMSVVKTKYMNNVHTFFFYSLTLQTQNPDSIQFWTK